MSLTVMLCLSHGLSRHTHPLHGLPRRSKTTKCNLHRAERHWHSSSLNVQRQIFVERKNLEKNNWFFQLSKSITARSCQGEIQASSCMDWPTSCLERAKVLFFFNDIPECKLPDHFCSFFEKKIAPIHTNHSELDSQLADGTPTLQSLFVAVNFVMLSQCCKSWFAN